MIQSLKTIKNRIRSIGNTKKVTSAMEMISVTKLNRTEKAFLLLRSYFTQLERILQDILAGSPDIRHPLLETRSAGKPCLCVITSDSGLCGVYNNNIIRTAEEFLRQAGPEKINLVCIGRRGFNYFKKRNFTILESYLGLNGRYSEKLSAELTRMLLDLYLSGKASQVHIAYTHFKTALLQLPKIEKLLNIEKPPVSGIEYILEPDLAAILNELIPSYISMKVKLVLLEAFTTEHSARAVAMKMATDNAEELLQGLVTLRNKVRQANITQELMDIISSSEALKG